MLNTREWKEFFIGGKDGIFEIFSTSSSIDKNKLILGEENIPYITRTDNNNGINLFIPKAQKDKYKIDKGNVITIGLDTQTVFYQPYKFYTGQNIQILKNDKLNRFNALFIIPIIKIQMRKFNWGGNGATLGRLSRTKIMLPVNKNDEPDWKFMEYYMIELEKRKRADYLKFVKNKLKHLKFKKIENLDAKEWKEFSISKLFTVKIGTSIDGNKIDKTSGETPYITRKESNNGLDGFIENEEIKMTKNYPVITIGNETAQPYVQQYPFYTGTKVNVLTPIKDLSEYILFFISTCLRQQKSKYNYSFTINSTRLKKQTILLPINDKEEPDYEYMEQYIKNLMFKKYNQYLKSL